MLFESLFLFFLAIVLLYVFVLLLHTIGFLHTTQQHMASDVGQTFVSIIIPARNEENIILTCLESIIKQNYPSTLFEVIIVDDHSEDNTNSITQKFITQHTLHHISILTLDEKIRGKKNALTQGINKAKGTLIITTDADCTRGTEWLSSIIQFYEAHSPMLIVSPVFLNHPNNFFQKMIFRNHLWIKHYFFNRQVFTHIF